MQAIDEAITAAKAIDDQPTLISAHTHIGHGSPNKQDTSGVHGSPLGDEEIALTKEAMGGRSTRPSRWPTRSTPCSGIGWPRTPAARLAWETAARTRRSRRTATSPPGGRPTGTRRRYPVPSPGRGAGREDLDPQGIGCRHQRDRGRCSLAGGRFRRSGPLQQHLHRRRGRVPDRPRVMGAISGSACGSTPWVRPSTA